MPLFYHGRCCEVPHLVLHLWDPLGTSTFICHPIWSLVSFCGFRVKHLVMGLETLLVSKVKHLQDEQRLEESTTRASRGHRDTFSSACVSPYLRWKVPREMFGASFCSRYHVSFFIGHLQPKMMHKKGFWKTQLPILDELSSHNPAHWFFFWLVPSAVCRNLLKFPTAIMGFSIFLLVPLMFA